MKDWGEIWGWKVQRWGGLRRAVPASHRRAGAAAAGLALRAEIG